ncbi:MAG: glycosyltransferase family 39 protein [Gemmataceae bacterium]
MDAPSERPWRWRAIALALILANAGAHIVYLVRDCPLDLAPDEAHYWDWSRHPDWSYYSKGPGIAWLIHASCRLFGPWAEAMSGSIMPAVRLPAVACGALLLGSLYVLAAQTLKRESWACALVAMALTVPPVAAGGFVMTIDSPFTACWGWALVFGYEAAVRQRSWAWPIVGLLVGLGILAKYTMVLFLPSVGLFLLADCMRRKELLRPGFWCMCALAGLCCVPIIVWNARHDWVTFHHVGWQAGVERREGWRWFGPLEFVGGQFALLLGYWFVAWAIAMIASRPNRVADTSRSYLWWLSAPTFGVFLLASLRTSGQLNWAVTAYLSGMVLAAGWLFDRWYRRDIRFGVFGACTIGVGVLAIVHFPTAARPVFLAIAGPPTVKHPLPLRRFDPTCRLRGYKTLASTVDVIRRQVRAGSDEPLLAANNWNLPGLLGVYCDGHPEVYCLGLALGDRRAQYDFWRPNPVWDPAEFRGKTFIVVGDVPPALVAAFESVEPAREIRHSEGGQVVAIWHATVARGFKGFAPIDQLLQGGKY